MQDDTCPAAAAGAADGIEHGGTDHNTPEGILSRVRAFSDQVDLPGGTSFLTASGACKPLGHLGYVLGSRDEGELVAKLVWRVKLVTALEAGETTEEEVARLERDEQAGLADLGLRLAEAKQFMAAIQAEIVPAQVTAAGEHRRTCVACEGELASKGHDAATFGSLFGDVPIRIRRLLTCPCQNGGVAKSSAAFDLEAASVARELAYVMARYAVLAPFGKVADLLSELLPISGAQNAGAV